MDLPENPAPTHAATPATSAGGAASTAGSPVVVAPGALTVRPISEAVMAREIGTFNGSFLQSPGWSRSKPDWQCTYLGWFDSTDQLVGVGAALAKSLPKVGRSFIYLPEGPALPWAEVAQDPARWTDPLLAWAKARKAFALRLGFVLTSRIWSPEIVKGAIADGGLLSFTNNAPTFASQPAAAITAWLDRNDWHQIGWNNSAAVGQPRYVCVVHFEGKDKAAVLKGMNQQWRRNIKKAEKVGVQVSRRGIEAVDRFHSLYAETAIRDKFVARAKSYFVGIMTQFARPDSGGRADIYEATLDGKVLASALMVTVGDTCSYLYGGSSTEHREVRASNALQWQAMQDALAEGAAAYDFRGFSTTLGAESPLTGLLQFKLGAGSDVVEVVGEREVVLSKFWHTAFDQVMSARVRVNTWRVNRRSTQLPSGD